METTLDPLERPFRGTLPRGLTDFFNPAFRYYQNDAVHTLLKAFERGAEMILDASDTGLGKTWVALETVKQLKVNFGVVCPANIVTKWENTASQFELEPEFVLSYEKLRTGKHHFVTRHRYRGQTAFHWNTVDEVVLIFDEVHLCSNYKSLNSKVLLGAINNRHTRIVGISASVAESPLKLRTIGYGLKLHGYVDWWHWCLQNGCTPGPFGGLIFSTGSRIAKTDNQRRAQAKLFEIHQRIFPYRGCRVRKVEVADQLPANNVIPEEVDVDFKHLMVVDEIKEVDRKDQETVTELVAVMRERQRLELAKCPVIFERVEDLLDEGNSVIVFLNFTKSIEVLHHAFTTRGWAHSQIVGGMTATERATNIDAFQRNHHRVCLCQSDAGSASIDLDDVTGDAPRTVLISPVYSARQLTQMLGRAHRLTTKSPVFQWILFAAKSVEERACKLVQQKLNNLSLLNDGDLSLALKVSK